LGGPVALDRVSVLQALRARRFADLDAALREVSGQALENPAVFDEVEWNAFRAFDIADPGLEEPLDAWVSEHPESAVAFAARATYRLARGWRERGNRFARDTADAAFLEFEKWRRSSLADSQRALELDPQLAAAWRERIAALGARGYGPDFERAIHQAIEIVPDSYRVRSMAMNFLRPRWGGSYELMDRWASLAMTRAKRVPRMARLRSRAALDRADVAEGERDFQRATAWVRDALAQDPADPEANDTYASILRREGKLSEAVEAIEKARAEVPDDPGFIASHISLLLAQGRDLLAAEHLARLEALDPSRSDLAKWRERLAKDVLDRCESAARTDDFSQAIALCDQAVAGIPTSERARYWRGRALLRAERWEEAQTDFEAALAADPRSRRSIENLDWLLARERKFEAIIELWDRYLELESQDAAALLERAGAKRHSGDVSGACADLGLGCRLGQKRACELEASYCSRR
jgi:tetratricopeptide (TPR) repeat protein